jgi:hypothetical protein
MATEARSERTVYAPEVLEFGYRLCLEGKHGWGRQVDRRASVLCLR